MNENVFIVENVGDDAGVYATGPQPNGLRGGPIAYVNRADAEAVAERVNGRVAARSLLALTSRCIEKGCTLFLRQPDGSTQYIEETTTYHHPFAQEKLAPINPDGSDRRNL